MRIDPCANKNNPLCCQSSNQDTCEDNTLVVGGGDLPVAWFFNGFVVRCSEEYEKVGQCGTYLEVHKPNSNEIIDETPILIHYHDGFQMQYVSTKNLCAGRYEIWAVVRTRYGNILQHVKPIFSRYPPCKEAQIDPKFKRNYEYYKAQPNAVNTIKLADGSFKLQDYENPPLPDWDAIDRLESISKNSGTSTPNDNIKQKDKPK